MGKYGEEGDRLISKCKFRYLAKIIQHLENTGRLKLTTEYIGKALRYD
jgi:hypothetical protein